MLTHCQMLSQHTVEEPKQWANIIPSLGDTLNEDYVFLPRCQQPR